MVATLIGQHGWHDSRDGETTAMHKVEHVVVSLACSVCCGQHVGLMELRPMPCPVATATFVHCCLVSRVH